MKRLWTVLLMATCLAGLSVHADEPRVLVYTRNATADGQKGFVHDNIATNVALIQKLGKENGFANSVRQGVFDVRDFGAAGDGATLNTAAIQQAIAACTAAGGGEVLVAGGRFVTGTIYLKDNVTLRIAAGATLLGSTNIADYATDTIRTEKDLDYLDGAPRTFDLQPKQRDWRPVVVEFFDKHLKKK